MAISIDLVYNSVQKISFKELGSGYLDPDAFNAYANMSVVELFNKYADEYQISERVTDRLLPFILQTQLPINENGRMLYPDDYVNRIAIRAFDPDDLKAAIDAHNCDDTIPINYNSIKQISVTVIDNNKVGNRLVSTVISPTLKRPIFTFYSGYGQFYPIDIGMCFFEYLRQPSEVVWAYTIGTDGLPVYDAANSISFEFDWMMTNELIIKICSYFGLAIRENELFAGAKAIEADQK